MRAVRKALGEQTGSMLAFLPGQGRDSAHRRAAGRAYRPTWSSPRSTAPWTPATRTPPSAPPRRAAKIVLATSIAETSLTIEGVRMVIDCGLARLPRYDPGTGLTRLETVRVSRAAADQRRGRAGRTEPGVCYRSGTGRDAALIPYDRPEILETDLARWP